MKQQALVWVSLPFSDFSERKIRPSLVVSNNEYNASHPDIVICAITSNLKKDPHSIFIKQEDLAEGVLPLASRIRGDKILQVEKTLVLKPFAALKDGKFDEVIRKIVKLLSRGKHASAPVIQSSPGNAEAGKQ